MERHTITKNGFIMFEDRELKKDPVKTKWSHPYSYDPITQFDSGKKATSSVYTDRMQQWDYKKYDRAAAQAFKNKTGPFCQADPKDIQQLLRLYNDNPKIKLVKVIEYCNIATGYPTWRLDYVD